MGLSLGSLGDEKLRVGGSDLLLGSAAAFDVVEGIGFFDFDKSSAVVVRLGMFWWMVDQFVIVPEGEVVVNGDGRADVDSIFKTEIEHFSLGDFLRDFVVGLFGKKMFLEGASVEAEVLLGVV